MADKHETSWASVEANLKAAGNKVVTAFDEYEKLGPDNRTAKNNFSKAVSEFNEKISKAIKSDGSPDLAIVDIADDVNRKLKEKGLRLSDKAVKVADSTSTIEYIMRSPKTKIVSNAQNLATEVRVAGSDIYTNAANQAIEKIKADAAKAKAINDVSSDKHKKSNEKPLKDVNPDDLGDFKPTAPKTMSAVKKAR